MHNLNEYIASCLEKVLKTSNTGHHFDFSQIMTYCAPLPSLKMLEVSTNPFVFNGKEITYGDNFYGENSYESVLDGLIAQFPLSTEINQTIAGLVYLKTAEKIDPGKSQLANKLLQKYKPVSWNPFSDCLKINQVRAVADSKKTTSSVTLISNRTQIAEPINSVL